MPLSFFLNQLQSCNNEIFLLQCHGFSSACETVNNISACNINNNIENAYIINNLDEFSTKVQETYQQLNELEYNVIVLDRISNFKMLKEQIEKHDINPFQETLVIFFGEGCGFDHENLPEILFVGQEDEAISGRQLLYALKNLNGCVFKKQQKKLYENYKKIKADQKENEQETKENVLHQLYSQMKPIILLSYTYCRKPTSNTSHIHLNYDILLDKRNYFILSATEYFNNQVQFFTNLSLQYKRDSQKLEFFDFFFNMH